jgi:hypothetical protein
MGTQSIMPSLKIEETTLVSFKNPFNGLVQKITLSEWLQINSYKLEKIVDNVLIVQDTTRYHQYSIFFMKSGCLELHQTFEVIEYCNDAILSFIKDAKKYLLLFYSQQILEIKRIYSIEKDNEYWIVMEDKAKRLNSQGIALETVKDVIFLHDLLCKKDNNDIWTLYYDGWFLSNGNPSNIVDIVIHDETRIVFYCRENAGLYQWFYLLIEDVLLDDDDVLCKLGRPFQRVEKYQGKVYLQRDNIWYVFEKNKLNETGYRPQK